MKKIFLLAGIIASSSAICQQKDLFDADSYIQKKQAEKNKVAEKIIPVFPFSNNYDTGNYFFLQ